MKVFVAHNVTQYIHEAQKQVALARLLHQLRDAGIRVCDPEETIIPHHEFRARFDYCLRELSSSNLLIVDASRRVGLGVGAEMMFARQKEIEVFAICPEHSYYRRELRDHREWLHPFIYGLATKVFGSVDDCVSGVLARKT